ncbi:MAG: hypothetical protein H7Y07_17680 [Pyrinomonadaceae bacterium]|nr:hypothetical protein [Sphingobacteriaceae bacterium]
MKRLLLFFIGCLFSTLVSAQYNHYRLSVGGGLGVARAFGDLEKNFIRPAIYGTYDYNFTPFVSVGLEIQKGYLKGGDSINLEIDAHQRFFKSSYLAATVSGKVQLGQFIDFERSNLLYAIRGFYIGTGIGLLNSKMQDIKRTKGSYTFPGKDSGMDFMIPINTGISFNFIDKWGFTKFKLGFNYQLNMVLGENLDGYNDPPTVFKNQHGDFYGVTSISFKYCYGPEGLHY